MRFRPRRTLSILAALFTLSATSLRADEAGPVWAVQGKSGTVYLAGSVHVLEAADAELPRGFGRAYAESERIVMELDMDGLDPMAAGAYLAEHAMLAPGVTLRSLLGPERYARIDADARELGLPLDSLQGLEPWAAALALTQVQLARLGLSAEHGVEQQIGRLAARDDKPLAGLETLQEQLGMLDGLSAADQIRFLELTAEEGETMEREIEHLMSAWRRSDVAALEHLLLDEYDRMPSLYGPLVSQRNRNWLPQIEALLARDDDTMVVVGAMHLVGPDGLLELLRERGYEAEKLR